MPDVVVTVPKNFEDAGLVGIEAWIKEGDAAGDPWSGEEWHFYLGGSPPEISRGGRVYIVNNGKLRGYAPLVRVEKYGRSFALVRHGGAVAMTIEEPITGFRGFRYRWWKYQDERPFLDWQIP
jgi:hypothetical protein